MPATGSTATTLQNFALNVNTATTGQLAGAAGDVTGYTWDVADRPLSKTLADGSRGLVAIRSFSERKSPSTMTRPWSTRLPLAA